MFPKYLVAVTSYQPGTPTTLAFGTLLESFACTTLAEANSRGAERASYQRSQNVSSTQFGEGVKTVQYAVYEQSAPAAAQPASK